MRVMDMDTFPRSYAISLKWLLFSSFHVMYWRQNLILKGGVNGGFQFKRSFGATNVQLAASNSPPAVRTMAPTSQPFFPAGTVAPSRNCAPSQQPSPAISIPSVRLAWAEPQQVKQAKREMQRRNGVERFSFSIFPMVSVQLRSLSLSQCIVLLCSHQV